MTVVGLKKLERWSEMFDDIHSFNTILILDGQMHGQTEMPLQYCTVHPLHSNVQ